MTWIDREVLLLIASAETVIDKSLKDLHRRNTGMK